MRDELPTDIIDEDACDAALSAASADTAAAVAEPHKYTKGRLKVKVAFWKLFCTSAWVLSWITDGYQIPWGEMSLPPPHAFANQQGALRLCAAPVPMIIESVRLFCCRIRTMNPRIHACHAQVYGPIPSTASSEGCMRKIAWSSPARIQVVFGRLFSSIVRILV